MSEKIMDLWTPFNILMIKSPATNPNGEFKRIELMAETIKFNSRALTK